MQAETPANQVASGEVYAFDIAASVFAHIWTRDPGSSFTASLSDAVQFVIAP